jgi:transglutaminase superfamily protein
MGQSVASTVEYSPLVDITHSTGTPPPPTEIGGTDVSLDTGDSSSKPEGRGAGPPLRSTVQHSGIQTDPMPTYFLAPHIYPCVTEDHVVLLDLDRDKYVGVAREQVSALARRVRGWPQLGIVLPTDAGEGSAPSSRAESVFAKMLAAGMLTTDADIGKEASPVDVPAASEALVQPDLDWHPRIRFIDVVRFLLASMLTSLSMRLLPLRAVMTGAMRRKAAGVATFGPVDVAIARRATEAFIRLRPLLFGAQDACLYDSLALARFLSYYRQFPACVIGVQTAPFGAHCWVQEAGFVFNDAPEYVRRFTPILAV